MLLDNSEIKWVPSSLLRQHCLNRLEHKKKHNNENSNSPKKGKTKEKKNQKEEKEHQIKITSFLFFNRRTYLNFHALQFAVVSLSFSYVSLQHQQYYLVHQVKNRFSAKTLNDFRYHLLFVQ